MNRNMAARTFSAAADGALASAAASWNGGTIPAPGDTLTFRVTSVPTCTRDTAPSGGGTTTPTTHSGTIIGTSGTWQLSGSWTQSGAATTFTHNSGNITISTSSTFNDTRSVFNKIAINGTANVTISASTTAPLGATPSTNCSATGTLTVAGTVTWTGAWTHVGGLTVTGTLTGTSTPTLSIDGSLTTS